VRRLHHERVGLVLVERGGVGGRRRRRVPVGVVLGLALEGEVGGGDTTWREEETDVEARARRTSMKVSSMLSAKPSPITAARLAKEVVLRPSSILPFPSCLLLLFRIFCFVGLFGFIFVGLLFVKPGGTEVVIRAGQLLVSGSLHKSFG